MRRRKKQVVITGCGMISACGADTEENAANIFGGMTGIKDGEFRYRDGVKISASGIIEGELPHVEFFEEMGINPDRASHLALIAAEECVTAGSFTGHEEDPLKIGVIIGTSLGGMRSGDVFHTQWLEEGIDKADREMLRQYPLHAVADIVAMKYGWKGARAVISTACSSGANAVGMAADLIRSGICHVALAGGVDPISRFSFAGFTSLQAIDRNPCRPYSGSTGINLGEGAAFFLLESDEHAEERGAKILGEVRGYGITADAYHATAPDMEGKGAVRAMNAAMEEGGCRKEELSYINGHGTGTPSNDNAEKKAWKAFVRDGKPVPMVSNKAALGHCMGAAGAVELAVSLMSIQKDLIPPTVNFEESGAEEIDFVPNKERNEAVENVLSNSFAFGGNNCSVLLSQYEKREETYEDEPEIVITGIGCTGSGGRDAEELFRTFREGRSWIEEIDTHGRDYRARWAAAMPEVEFKKHIPGRVLRRIDQVTRLAMTSGKEALVSSGLKITQKNAERIGVIYGTGTGPLETIEKVSRTMIETGCEAVNANTFPNTVLNAAPGNFSIVNMLKGPTSTISAGSVSGLDAFVYACELLKKGKADAIVALSADEWTEALQTGNEKLGLLTATGALPFSKAADGMILAPGSAAFVLERRDSAEERGANILGRVMAYAMTSDNSPLNGFYEESQSWADSIRAAREAAGVEKIDYYSAGSYGIPVLDRMECRIIEEVLDEDTMVFSVPRLIGSASGSVGCYGLLSCLYAIKEGNSPAERYSEKENNTLKEVFARAAARKGRGIIETAAVSCPSFGGSYTTVIIGREDK
ncbi:MAG TPA: beta-ketoacyl-[acyl-carrier-protein] synthase family protein [Candidatus Copromorpha excrementigallinarum]|uniref:Beta-ketoacyl-[acyl-carrier-protein] synthase family protein n=1 Tax=Candidatus Allocopromorpha excrementigallinarum TaxID=2840742 RepID=A0A9D1L7U5_9FIRM|nr:beta-ketoacyl-[acyl-carrier-protein] synthase family protein [Candidatus Copromorpha excrementigallinarum]